MKSFEENMVRWVDGALSPQEAEAFEKSAPNATAIQREREIWQSMRVDFRKASVSQGDYARDAEFLSSQISRLIRADLPGPHPVTQRASLPSIWKLVWSGGALAVIAFAMILVVANHNDGIPSETQFISQVIEARSTQPERFATYSFAAPDGRGTVIWIDTPGFIPSQEGIR